MYHGFWSLIHSIVDFPRRERTRGIAQPYHNIMLGAIGLVFKWNLDFASSDPLTLLPVKNP